MISCFPEEFFKYGFCERAGLIVIDMRVPEMSGVALQKILVEPGSKMPIIFITTHWNGKTCRWAMESGSIAFLHKSFVGHALLDAVCNVLIFLR